VPDNEVLQLPIIPYVRFKVITGKMELKKYMKQLEEDKNEKDSAYVRNLLMKEGLLESAYRRKYKAHKKSNKKDVKEIGKLLSQFKQIKIIKARYKDYELKLGNTTISRRMLDAWVRGRSQYVPIKLRKMIKNKGLNKFAVMRKIYESQSHGY